MGGFTFHVHLRREVLGTRFAIFFTFAIMFSISGSCCALMIWYAHAIHAAAKDGFLTAWFGEAFPDRKWLLARPLAVIGACSVACNSFKSSRRPLQ